MSDQIELQRVKVNEGAPTKARRYLLEGRLRVLSVHGGRIWAVCRGDGETYDLGYSGRWHCSCDARSSNCSHLIALRLVVDRPAT